jgi:hypothetical protein
MLMGRRSRFPDVGTLVVAPLALLLAGCAPKPVTLHIQGTVQTVGSDVPIPGAQVLIQWPASLGGGESRLTTDRQGHFAVGRTLRPRNMDCSGFTLTVQAEHFASAYDRHREQSCGKGAVLDFTINMLRQPG